MGELAKPFKQQLAFDEQRNLYDYWRSKCRPGALPQRCDLHPRDMIGHLPFITLTDVMHKDQHHRFKIRLAGTGLRKILNTEITGHTLDELPFGNAAAYWQQVHERIVEERAPLCGITPLVWHGDCQNMHTALNQFWIKFPLVNKNGEISTILAYDIFTPLEDLSPVLQSYRANA